MKDGYYDKLLRDFDLQNCRPVRSPSWNPHTEEEEEGPLPEQEISKFRMAVGKLIWCLVNRPDLSYVIKELTAHLQTPTMADYSHLKWVLRFLQGSQHWILRLQCDFNFEVDKPMLMVDANWAGNEFGRSTSNGTLFLDGFLVQAFCKTQSVIALSMCEAELLVANYGVAEGFLLGSILEEMGIEPTTLEVYIDSSSTLQFICKRGLGRLRHIRIRELWLQDQLRLGTIKLVKIPSQDNVADIMTRRLTPKKFQEQARRLGLRDEADP